MDRKEFLSKLGAGAAFALTVPCLVGCGKDNGGTVPDVDFTVDINQFDSLRIPGNFIIQNEVVVANNLDGQYIAATILCSHENLKQIKYNRLADNWECTAHGARYTQDGVGLNENGAGGLTTFNVTQDGDILRIFSS